MNDSRHRWNPTVPRSLGGSRFVKSVDHFLLDDRGESRAGPEWSAPGKPTGALLIDLAGKEAGPDPPVGCFAVMGWIEHRSPASFGGEFCGLR
jgi:hypothetical protein